MHFVREQLALGSRADAESAPLLAAAGISAVLSLEPTRKAIAARQFLLPIEDRVPLLEESLGQAFDFLDRAIEKGDKVLLHCEMGISRSPAILAAYLVVSEGLDADTAIATVQAACPGADPHPALRASLYQLASTRKAATTMRNARCA